MSETQIKTTAEVLRGMRDYIEEKGWTQNRLQSTTGAVCLLGAKNAVMWGNPFSGPKVSDGVGFTRNDAVTLALAQCINSSLTFDTLWEAQHAGGFVDVAQYNDEEGRTKDDVVEMLDKCADKQEEVSK